MMIKRFVSNALLSLVMDKSARDKLARANDAKAPSKAPASRAPAAGADAPAHPDAVARQVRVRSPAQARAEDTDDPLAIIEDAIAEARRSLGMDPPKPGSGEMAQARKAARAHPPGRTDAGASDREKLIAQALAIHAQKTKMLDELGDDHRDKLRLMAIKALDPEAFEKIKAEATGERPRRPKR